MVGQLVSSMRDWVSGVVPLPTMAEFLAFHGKGYLNYRLADTEDYFAGLRDITQAHMERQEYIAKFGFAIPCREAVEAVVAGGPVVEIGAGTGYWAALIAQQGGDVVATDSCQQTWGSWKHGQYFAVERLAGKTAVRRYRDRNVFCSWPSLQQTWFRQALKAMRVGRTLFYVEESATADESARAYLEDFFVEEAHINIPCFSGLHDVLVVYRKVEQGPWAERQRSLQRSIEEDRKDMAHYTSGIVRNNPINFPLEIPGEYIDAT